MIYTVGNTKNYFRFIAEQGRIRKGVGGSVWLTRQYAAKKFGRDERAFCREYPAREALARHGISVETMPLGAALGIVQLVAVWRIDRNFTEVLTEQERAFGNYAPGRYAWEMKVLYAFPTPIPMKGQQSIFDVFLPVEDGDREQPPAAPALQVIDDRPVQLSLF